MPSNMRFMNPETIAKPGGYTHVVEVVGPAGSSTSPANSG